jgi:hypothetical protein
METLVMSGGVVPSSSAIGPLSTGSFSLAVWYTGDSNYGASFDCDTFTVLATGGRGTMTANTGVVSAGAPAQTIIFTYTLASSMTNGEVQLTVPSGWSPPYGGATSPGLTTTSKGSVIPPTGSGRRVRIVGITGSAGSTVTITNGARIGTAPGATAPTAPGAQTWTAMQKSTTSGSPAALAASPVITVMAKDGSGTMTATPIKVKHKSTGKTITFTYTVATGGMADGAIDLKVPKGWSLPSASPSAAGYVTTTSGFILIAGNGINIGGLTLAAGAKVTITYGSRVGGGPGATAPRTAVGIQKWKAREESTPFPFSRFKALASSPKIKVT